MKNRKGFTIVELVIVIAVVAILAAVLIPTFAGIVKRANISADIQTARNMGTILAAEKPIDAGEVVDALKANGFERLHPKTKFYSFFWIQSKNIVVLTDEGIRPIFPEEMADAIFDPLDWVNLTDEYINAETKAETLPPEPPISPEPPVVEETTETTAPPEETTSPPREFVNVTITCNKPEYIQETLVNTTVKYGDAYQIQLTPADGGQYWITKVSIYKGGKQHKTHHGNPGSSYGFADINMTEDLEINIHVVKYCVVTFEGEGIKDSGYTDRGLRVELGVGAMFEADKLKEYFIPAGYEIVSATAQMGDKTLSVYDPERQILHLRSITDNTVVTFEFREKSNN